MQQNQQMQSQGGQSVPQPRKKKPDTSLILRAIVFGIVFLALLIFGIVLIANSASSLAIMLTAFFAVITAILTLMQVAPIIFPRTDSQTVVNNFYQSSVPTSASTSHTLHSSTTVFHYNTPLPDKDEFYGRELQRETLIDRTRKGASTAIDGDRRIGKTWLMRYLQLIAPEHAQLGAKYRVGYVSATSAECKTVTGFVLRAIEVLKAPNTETDPQHVKLETLSKAIHTLQKLDMIPVLCIDEFERFNENRQEFNLEFLEGLRAMTQEVANFVLITASKKPLDEIVADMSGGTSPPFNMMQRLHLEPFNEPEAKQFVQDKGAQAGFSEQDQAFHLKYATLHKSNGEQYWPPLCLQLVGEMMQTDKKVAQHDPNHYNPSDQLYCIRFEQRLNDEYGRVVKQS